MEIAPNEDSKVRDADCTNIGICRLNHGAYRHSRQIACASSG